MMKRFFATTASVAILGAAASFAANAADVTLKFQHFLPKQSDAHKNFFAPWAKSIEEASNGRIEVKVYPSMQLGGKPPALVDQVKDGFIDLAWVLPGYTPGRFPAISAFELPFMVTNAEETSQALQAYYEANPSVQEEFADVRPLFFWTHARGVLYSKDEPLLTVDDFDGKKLRNPTRPVSQALSVLGASPIGMPLPDTPQALSKNVIDGAVVPFEIVAPLRLHELVDHAVELEDARGRGLYTTVFSISMNKAKYDSLDPELKAVIDAHSGMEWSKRAGAVWDQSEIPGRKLIVEKAQLHQMAPEQVERIVSDTQDVATDWVREMNDRGLDGQALLNSATEMLDKYSN